MERYGEEVSDGEPHEEVVVSRGRLCGSKESPTCTTTSISSSSSFHGRYYGKNEDEKGRSKGFDGWIDASRVQNTQYCE